MRIVLPALYNTGELDNMRLSMATAISVALAATLFAGCSTSPQGSSALPGSSSANQPMGKSGPPHWQIPTRKISPLELLKLQVAGKVPGPGMRGALKRQLQRLEGKSRPQYHFRNDGGGAKAWSDDTDFGYLIGLSKKFKSVSDINVESNGCFDPITVKVDHSHNIWTACEEGPVGDAGAAQEYSSTGTLMNSYNAGCPSNISPSQCYEFFSESFDQFENSSNVFATLTYFENCGVSTCDEGYGFEYWPNGSPSSQPTLINVNGLIPGVDVFSIYYADIDSSGNIWFDYEGEDSSYPYSFGFGIAEVQNPTTSPTVVAIAPPGSLEFAGGVYTSNGSSRVWVTDQELRTTTEWTGGVAGTVLGPTATDIEGLGDPVSGGFNSTDTKVGFGDAYGWADACTIATMICKVHPSADMPDGSQGFAYQPSDK